MKKLTLYICLISLLFPLNACKPMLMKKEMIQLDRNLVPVFYYVYKGDLLNTRLAMQALNIQWENYKSSSIGANKFQQEWMQSVERADTWMQQTNLALEDGDLYGVLIQLDHARYEMMDFRWRMGMDYYLDGLWELEASISVTVDVAASPILGILGWDEFQDLCDDVWIVWSQLKEQSIEQRMYELSDEEMLLLSQREQNMEMAIVQFLRAVDEEDGYQFVESLKQLEPAYLELLESIGDFDFKATNSAMMFTKIENNIGHLWASSTLKN